MKLFISVLLVAASMANSDFLEHVAEYGLSYGTIEEYNFRMTNWAILDKEIREHNSTESNYKLGHNKMSTYTETEYKRLSGRVFTGLANNEEHPSLKGLSYPTSIDWRAKGAVTPAKDQGNCGSCWSFSATGCLEGIWKIQGNPLISFSEQQLIDCDYSRKENSGCNGGDPGWAFDYYLNGKGKSQAMTESDYPYKEKKGKCAYDNSKATKLVTVSQGAPKSNSVSSMKKAAAIQPLSVGVDANSNHFQAYKSGVFDAKCGHDLDHATLVVGYGTDSKTKQDYWIMKNSWASDWGEKGFMRLVINGDGPGQCGIQNDVVFATTGSA